MKAPKEYKGTFGIIRVTSNQRTRTFTIRKIGVDGKPYAKYRTIRQSRIDFNYYDNYATGRDWAQLLKTNEYYEL